MDNFRSSAAYVEMHQFVRIIQQGSLSGTAPAFRAANSLAFPASDVTQFSDKNEIVLSCLGLHGVSSPLPHYFITDALDEENVVLREFLSIFNQQLYRAYFNAWQHKHPHLFHETCLVAHEMLMTFEYPAGLAELFLHQERSLSRVQDFIHALYPGIANKIIILDCQWLEVHEPARLATAAACLGDNITLGKRIATYAHRIKVELGPLSYEQFQTLNPSVWIARFLKSSLDIDLQWTFDYQDEQYSLGNGMRLGWVSTLGKRISPLVKAQYAIE